MYILVGYIAWNVIVFFLYGLDKLKGKANAWRIPEKTLILCAIFFGAVGALVGMRTFHHKTRHTKFRVLVPLFAVLNVILLAFALCEPERIDELLPLVFKALERA